MRPPAVLRQPGSPGFLNPLAYATCEKPGEPAYGRIAAAGSLTPPYKDGATPRLRRGKGP